MRPNYKLGNERKHAAKRLRERYNAENSQGLIKALEREIRSGNFRIISQTTNGLANGYVNYQKVMYLVGYNLNRKRIMTVLPQEAGKRYHKKVYQKE